METNQLAAVFARNNINRCAILASTFRSGSTWVAELIERNGLPGLDKERFGYAFEAGDGYFDDILAPFAGETFATKLMWPHRCDLARLLGHDREASSQFARSFPNATWLFVRRRENFRQAVSFWRAKQSGRWHVYNADTQSEPVLEYSFDEIDACQRELVLHEHLWSDFFRQAGITPHEVIYEDLLDNPRLLEPYLRAFGIEMTYTGRVNLRRQSDALSEEYVARYTSELYA
jgi:LPS sulfotransferase NodH